jgi:hypothetical protein
MYINANFFVTFERVLYDNSLNLFYRECCSINVPFYLKWQIIFIRFRGWYTLVWFGQHDLTHQPTAWQLTCQLGVLLTLGTLNKKRVKSYKKKQKIERNNGCPTQHWLKYYSNTTWDCSAQRPTHPQLLCNITISDQTFTELQDMVIQLARTSSLC